MYRFKSPRFVVSVILVMLSPALMAQKYDVGKALTIEEIQGWDIDVRPDGQGLPKGSGTAFLGKPLYMQHCAACHGVNGEGKPSSQLVGGKGTLNTAKPVMTVGSFWAYATTVFDYINRAMPFNAPQSLKADEVYAITAYLLYMNQIIGESDLMNSTSLPKVVMPNRNGFVSDPRPDLNNYSCRDSCR